MEKEAAQATVMEVDETSPNLPDQGPKFYDRVGMNDQAPKNPWL